MVSRHSSVNTDKLHKPLVGTGVLDCPYKRKANQEAPSGRELARNATEGECVPVKITVNLYLRILLPSPNGATFLPEEGYR